MWKIKKWLIVAVVFLTVFVAMKSKSITTYYHKHCFQRSLSANSHISGAYQIVEMNEFVHHRDRLVDLGAMIHRKYVLDAIPNTRESRQFVLRKIETTFPDHYLWELDTNFLSLEPMILEVWEDKVSGFVKWDRLLLDLEGIGQIEQEGGSGEIQADR